MTTNKVRQKRASPRILADDDVRATLDDVYLPKAYGRCREDQV